MIKIVPQPKVIRFSGKWVEFDGFKNFPEFLANEFSIPKGSWQLEIIQKDGTGVEVKNKKVKIWGNLSIAYATVIQLLLQQKGLMPEIYVEEEFKFKFRGYHLDIARGGVPKVETFKNILKWLFILKYTHFAIYVEDLFPWEKHPKIGAARGRLTKEELKEVVEYGSKLGIEVFPSLELTGHMEHILSIPEYSQYSEWYLPREGCLNISDEKARNFAYELLEEVLEFFPSKFVHIGGDETWALGRGKSLEKNWMFEGPKLYEQHHKKLIEIVEEYSKTPLLWGDMLTGAFLNQNERNVWSKLLESDIWSRVVIANWDYAAQPKEYFIKRIENFGERYKENQIVCPGFSNWHKFYPDFESSTENIKNFINAAADKKLNGFLVTAWGDDGEECLFSFLNPLLVVTIEYAEGNGNWEESWILLSGENEKLLNVRKVFGNSIVTNNLKKLLYGAYNYQQMSDEEKEKVKNALKKALETSEGVNLPEDLALAKQIINVCLKRLGGDLRISDLLEVANIYARLWLSERKKEGLELIVSRLWASAGRLDLGF